MLAVLPPLDPAHRPTGVAPGSRLGPYEIVARLGSGGMGDVFRAHDPRLERDVAIKVLLARFSTDADRLRRFEQEARATGMLNHPNIVAIHDTGVEDGTAYVVTELLDGATLRELVTRGPLPPRKVVEYASQIAWGLDAAHRKGVVHRDVKPENLFVTHGGYIKILDFGLAKLRELDPRSRVDGPTWASVTQPGAVLGTVGYMAPEQVRGEEADHRSDIFALGAVAYEMLTGRRAFERASVAETLSAILNEDPPDTSHLVPHANPVLDRIICRCLEKRPEDRFQSAHDLAAAFEALLPDGRGSRTSGLSNLSGVRGTGRLRLAAALALVIVAAGAYAMAVHRSPEPVAGSSGPQFQRLTFRRGWISAARFAPESHTVLYSASWDGRPAEIFLVRRDNPESRPLGIDNADLLSVSRAGELAILRAPQLTLNIYHRLGTLAKVSLGGGAPRDILASARYGDWGPDGDQLAVIRDVGGRRRLEYPVGHPVYESPNASSNTIVVPRVSPDGERVAFFEGFGARVARWSVSVVDRQGNKSTLSPDWYDWWRLAWSPDGEEVWFGASLAGSASALYAVNLAGRQRLVFRVPGTIELHDVSPGGQVLVTSMTYRTFTRGVTGGERAERDLSWLDGSAAVGLSRDGTMLLLDEHGEGGGATNAAYIRRTDGAAAIRLGPGRALALSPDGRWVLATTAGSPVGLSLLPTGAGEPRALDASRFELIRAGTWIQQGERESVLLAAAEPGRGLRLYVQDVGGEPDAITPEGFDINGDAVSPDGESVAAVGPGGEIVLWPIDGGEPQAVRGSAAGDIPAGWTADGRSLYVFQRGELPVQIFRLEIASGTRRPWRSFMPPDPAGVGSVGSVLVTPDGTAAVYSYEQALSELYLIENLR